MSLLKKLLGLRDHLCNGKTLSWRQDGFLFEDVHPCPICGEPTEETLSRRKREQEDREIASWIVKNGEGIQKTPDMLIVHQDA